MAKATQQLTTTKGPAGGGQSLAVTSEQLPAGFSKEEIEKYAGAGISTETSDQLIPFLAILQDMSPQVKKRDAGYIDGAEPGMVLQTATKRLYTAEAGVLFQPCYFAKYWVEWISRSSGGGFVTQHLDRPFDAVEKIEEREGRDVRIWKRPNGNELIETRYHFGHVLDEISGSLEPAVVAMSSTGHTASRQWMTMMAAHQIAGHRAPSWFRAYRLRSTTKKNAQGEWFTWGISEVGWINDSAIREQGRLLHESVRDGQRQAAAPVEASLADKELPI